MRTTYNDLNGNSGIASYEIFEDAIDVEFSSGKVYTYTKANLGEMNFAVMAALADAGAGLNAFLNKLRRSFQDRTPNPVASPAPKEAVKVSLDTTEAVEVITELLKNFDVSISVA